MPKKKIDGKKFYSLKDIAEGRFFWWAKTIPTIRKHVLADLEGKNILKAKVLGTGRQSRYWIQGKNITRFISHFERN